MVPEAAGWLLLVPTVKSSQQEISDMVELWDTIAVNGGGVDLLSARDADVEPENTWGFWNVMGLQDG